MRDDRERVLDADILKVVSDFLQALERSDLHMEAAYLYGSHASGRARPDSDIDVAIISSDFDHWLADQERVSSVLLLHDTRIEPVRFRPEEFCDENPLAWKIKTTGIRLR